MSNFVIWILAFDIPTRPLTTLDPLSAEGGLHACQSRPHEKCHIQISFLVLNLANP